MSWSVSVENVESGELYDALEGKAEEYFDRWVGDATVKWTAESAEQASTATDVAQVIADQRFPDQKVNVTISGHANPGHDRSQGAPEYIAVTVNQSTQ